MATSRRERIARFDARILAALATALLRRGHVAEAAALRQSARRAHATLTTRKVTR